VTDGGPTLGLGDALDGVRVVEWGRGIAPRYAGRMLADFGAAVTRVIEPPDVDGGESSPEADAFFDAGKSGRAVDAATTQGRAALHELLRDTDILVDDRSPAERVAVGLAHAALAQELPRLLQVAVTPFGLTGPYRDFRAGDLEIAFLSGLAYLTPRDIPRGAPGADPPLKMPGSLVSVYAGASAAGAALTALRARDDGAHPGIVDVSMLESLIPTLRREIALFQYEGRVASRFMRVWRLAPWGVKRCLDGHVFLQVVERHHWEGLVDMMGGSEWARDPRYLDPDYRFEHRVDIETRLAPWLRTQPKARFAWEAQRREVPFAPVNEVADLPRIPQLHSRGFFRTVNAADGRPCVVPGTPFNVTTPRQAAPRDARGDRDPARTGPLRGIRVIDFGHVWAGPYCAALLADMGAEVIKIESAQRLDVHRRQGPYAERRVGVNRSGVWNAQNRGKRSVTLNLATERGRELAAALVDDADVVIENFAPGVMKRLGLDYPMLSARRPGLVMASLSAFGQEGPQRSYVGYGPSLDAWAGLDALTAHAGGEPNALGGIFPDTGSALHAAAAILAALRRRDRTGSGCYIDLSELEVSILLLGDAVARELGGETIRATGNHDGRHVPQGAWPCAGDDAWIALSVVDEPSWQGLCAALGRVDWAADPALRTPEGREPRAGEIDAAIAAWASARERHDAMLTLQRHRVPSGEAHDARSLLADPHLVERGFFASIVHPEVGPHPVYAPIWRLDGAATRFDAAAPVLGADNQYVLERILGVAPADVARLVAERIVY
jgi:crotonobetainyl-CoA:carnitine CoA-transferase CaiB-like acyl-CoA transferase